jgi:hypothetical protein
MYEDLLTYGYSIIPNFLNKEEIDFLLNDYYNNSRSAVNLSAGKHDMREASDQTASTLFPKLKEIISASPIPADVLMPGGLYVDSTKINLDWHQDHSTFFLLQEHYKLLKFYITIFKTDVNQSGLSIINFKTLEEYDSIGARKLINNGATRFEPFDNCTKVLNDNTGEEWILNVNLDKIKVSPALSAGDLLVCRGDIIHRTQDNHTHRIAIVLHSVDGNIIIDIKNTIPDNESKKYIFESNKEEVEAIKNIFHRFGKDKLTVYEWMTE